MKKIYRSGGEELPVVYYNEVRERIIGQQFVEMYSLREEYSLEKKISKTQSKLDC